MNPIEAVSQEDPYPYYATLVERPIHWNDELRMWIAASAQSVTAVLASEACRVAASPLPKLFAANMPRWNDGERHRELRTVVDELMTEVDASFFRFEDVKHPETLLARYGDDVKGINKVGLLIQAHDATRGLIGNTLVALARTRERFTAAMLDDVLRNDSPVQNTRRVLAEDAVIDGVRMRAGDTIVVILAAANRDPHANGQLFTFGLGVHACPGRALATQIADREIRKILDSGFEIALPPRYEPLPNARIPILGLEHAA